MEPALYKLIDKIEKVVAQAADHPQWSATFVLATICATLVAIALIYAYDRFQLDKVMGNAANDAIEVPTSEALFMVIIGATCLIISVGTVIWYLQVSDTNILELFLTGKRY